ncbi:ACP S-malonyltransferase [Paenibacillus glacialis]|uniref:[acyl-carrier-protein] S-malonyltransferase n=1 Tax=Paenibacillus glacialis TaxID=494026 RepID=A0A162K933_9BACL|nr:ACP S-malonyltransferase [Paenibacillus glacialis]OAB42408.1 hypothetical protein PGLA_12090 [Paenibacillus glacialis]
MEKISFLFPGQGSQFVGMSKSLFNQYEIAKQTFEEANEILGIDLAKICFEGSLAELAKNDIAQPAILVSSVVAFRVYMQEIGITPQFCAGHSLGEYSALTCAGAITFADAVSIARFRGRLADQIALQDVGAMSIIDGIDKSKVEEECRKLTTPEQVVAISCYNSPTQTSISGEKEIVLSVEEKLLSTGCMVTPLLASAPFHSPLMTQASELLRAELEQYSFNWFKFPVISNVTGLPYNDPDQIVANLVQHMIKPVQWQATIQYLKRKGITLTVEMGPKNVLSNLVAANVEGIEALCFAEKEDRQSLSNLHERFPFLRKHFPTIITRCLAAGVATPNTNWNNEEYQAGAIVPYKRIQDMLQQLKEEGTSPTEVQMTEALELLKTIFQTKKLPVKEQEQWFKQMVDETGNYYTLRDTLNRILQELVSSSDLMLA